MAMRAPETTSAISFYGDVQGDVYGNATSADKVNCQLTIAGKVYDGSEAVSISNTDLIPEETLTFIVSNPTLTSSTHDFTWTITKTQHQMSSNAMTVQIYDNSGNMILTNVQILSNLNVLIKFYDASATTIASNTYKAVIIGLGSTQTVYQNASTGALVFA